MIYTMVIGRETATSTQLAIHTRPVTCDFTMHTAQWRTGQTVRSDAYTNNQFISLAENASALPPSPARRLPAACR